MLVGDQVGSYRILARIGAGGMGSVWAAEHLALGRRVAIKVLHPEHSVRPDLVRRFFNEARAAAAIADPGIVQVFDFGNHVDGSAYIVMELLDGEPLDKRLAGIGRLTLVDGLRVVRQIASTLGAAHDVGIIHRDVKPENIFLVRDPEVIGGERAKILDFGIAKLASEPTGEESSGAAGMGTPNYMSPEQCRGGEIDERTDVYSLGCVLFTLLIGRPPFKSENAVELMGMHLQAPPPVASMCLPGIPREIDRVIARCLAKVPRERFPSGTELAAALGELLGETPVPVRPSLVNLNRPAEVQAPRWLASTMAVASDHNDGDTEISAPLDEPATEVMPSTPTTLTGATGQINTLLRPPRRPRRRARRLVIGGVVVVGIAAAVAAVTVFAIPTTSLPARPATPVAEPAGPAPPQPATPPAAPSTIPAATTSQLPQDVTSQHIAAVLTAFAVAWMPGHAGKPCPTIHDVAAGDAALDGWGHTMLLTCTDQPGDQMVGVRSAGADGVLGTYDDITSWTLGRDVTAAVAGPRWAAAAAPPPEPAGKPAAKAKPRPATPATTAKPAAGFELDADGIPVSRRPK